MLRKVEGGHHGAQEGQQEDMMGTQGICNRECWVPRELWLVVVMRSSSLSSVIHKPFSADALRAIRFLLKHNVDPTPPDQGSTRSEDCAGAHVRGKGY